tara:strand:- start:54 stop:1706 length:1653 start_codon:yes stop_codon:yes gene_type:complete
MYIPPTDLTPPTPAPAPVVAGPPKPAKKKPEQKDALLDNNPKFAAMFGSLVKSFEENLEFVKAESKEDRAAREAAERAAKAESVSDEDTKKGESLRSRMGGAVKGIKEGAGKTSDLLKTVGKFLLKGLGVAMITPMIIDFINGFVDGVINNTFGEKNGKKFGSAIKTGAILAVVGGLLFGPMAILPLFFAGIIGSLGKKLVDGLDEKGLARLGIDKKTLGGVVASVGAALGLFVPLLLKKAIVGTAKLALNLVKGTGSMAAKAVSAATGAITGKGAAGGGAKPSAASVLKGGKMPSGMSVNAHGRVINSVTGKFVGAEAIKNAMKAEGRLSQAAKYMKFFKFAGPALAVVPALIDPLMAIYRGESKDEIHKQLAGALGTVGGASLGGLAGAAFGTGIFPGVGTLIGGLLGGGVGAFLGEDLAEAIAGAVLDGDDLDPNAVKKSRRQNRIGGAGVKKVSTPSGGAIGQAVKSQLSAKNVSVGGRNGRSSSNVQSMEEGTQAVLASSNNVNIAKGGDTMNSTNVGGNSTTYNIINGGGNSLSNAGHLPVAMG